MLQSLRTLLPVAVVSMLLACSATKADRNKTPYPTQVANYFVNACVAKGSSQAKCSCVFKRIQGQYTYQEFVQILEAQAAQTGQMPPEMLRLISECK